MSNGFVATIQDTHEDHTGDLHVVVKSEENAIVIEPVWKDENGLSSELQTPVSVELHEGSLRIVVVNDDKVNLIVFDIKK